MGRWLVLAISGSAAQIIRELGSPGPSNMSLPAERRNLAATRVPNGMRRGGHRTGLRTTGTASLAVSFQLCLGYAAEARPARCYTSDDGFYGCDFVASPRVDLRFPPPVNRLSPSIS